MAEPNKRISELTNTAIKLSEIDHNIPFKRYLRASKEISRTANFYLQDNQLENAFILYSKYCTLFVEKFPKHPEYKPFTSNEKKLYAINITDSFNKAEAVKQKLLRLYKVEYEKAIEKQKQAKAVIGTKTNISVTSDKQPNDDTKKSKQEKEAQELRALEERFKDMKTHVFVSSPEASNIGAGIPPIDLSPGIGIPNVGTSGTGVSTITSDRWEDGGVINFTQEEPSAPPPTAPSFDRTLKPTLDTASKSLRHVVFPCDLADVFLKAVKSNSDNNIETCGILLGSLCQNKWKVSRLLIPQQIGGSDTCDITNEEEMVAYQDEHDLITLGWIHTHPSQTAFLSSVDQHTQWPYQKFFPEAVAVVCSPKYNETGYFNLSDEGMDFVKDCQGRGFHQHPINPPLFQTCNHVQFDAAANVVLTDLRK